MMPICRIIWATDGLIDRKIGNIIQFLNFIFENYFSDFESMICKSNSFRVSRDNMESTKIFMSIKTDCLGDMDLNVSQNLALIVAYQFTIKEKAAALRL